MYKVDFNKPCKVHFIGIGGISMSGLAEILMSEGFTVTGSDRAKSELTEKLEKSGAVIYYGQRESNIADDLDLVVYTAAISKDNPELCKAIDKKIPMLTRAQLLGQLMLNYKTPIAISGTHGKTTTTSMISEILMKAETDPTLSIGGILRSVGGNYRVGSNNYFVTEACEYTNSYLEFYPRISLILNIEEDHLDFFKDINDIRNSFHRFALRLPKDGALIINGDIDNLSEITADVACPVHTYGSSSSSDYYPEDISFDEFGRGIFTLKRKGKEDVKVELGVVGIHNVYNACAALLLSDLLELDINTSVLALKHFTGSDRRFEFKGKLGDISIIDDYAHHPTEIKATLNACRNYPHKELWCIFQPHTYTRTNAFLNEFAEALSLADHVVLADIYAAREKNTIGITSRDLLKKIEEKGTDVHYFPTFDEIENFILENCSTNDMLITMGAGDIVKVGENLLGK